jgi:hypothetical protein
MEYFIVRVHYSEVESATYEGRYESVRKDMLETVPKIEDFLFDGIESTMVLVLVTMQIMYSRSFPRMNLVCQICQLLILCHG